MFEWEYIKERIQFIKENVLKLWTDFHETLYWLTYIVLIKSMEGTRYFEMQKDILRMLLSTEETEEESTDQDHEKDITEVLSNFFEQRDKYEELPSEPSKEMKEKTIAYLMSKYEDAYHLKNKIKKLSVDSRKAYFVTRVMAYILVAYPAYLAAISYLIGWDKIMQLLVAPYNYILTITLIATPFILVLYPSYVVYDILYRKEKSINKRKDELNEFIRETENQIDDLLRKILPPEVYEKIEKKGGFKLDL